MIKCYLAVQMNEPDVYVQCGRNFKNILLSDQSKFKMKKWLLHILYKLGHSIIFKNVLAKATKGNKELIPDSKGVTKIEEGTREHKTLLLSRKEKNVKVFSLKLKKQGFKWSLWLFNTVLVISGNRIRHCVG